MGGGGGGCGRGSARFSGAGFPFGVGGCFTSRAGTQPGGEVGAGAPEQQPVAWRGSERCPPGPAGGPRRARPPVRGKAGAQTCLRGFQASDQNAGEACGLPRRAGVARPLQPRLRPSVQVKPWISAPGLRAQGHPSERDTCSLRKSVCARCTDRNPRHLPAPPSPAVFPGCPHSAARTNLRMLVRNMVLVHQSHNTCTLAACM